MKVFRFREKKLFFIIWNAMAENLNNIDGPQGRGLELESKNIIHLIQMYYFRLITNALQFNMDCN